MGGWVDRNKHFLLDTWVAAGNRPGLQGLPGNQEVIQGSHPVVGRGQGPPSPLVRSRGVVILVWAAAVLQSRQSLEGTGVRFGSPPLLQQLETTQHLGLWATLEKGQKAAWTHPSAEAG